MKKMMMIAALIAAGTSAIADEKHFAFVNEAITPHEGELEFEQWITGRFGRDEGDYARWDFREEIEYGFTDDFAAALYLNFTDVHTGVEGEEGGGLDFKGFSFELKRNLSDPYTSPLGSQLYLEYTTDGASHELEEKIIFSKSSDNWTFAFNTVFEQEWENEDGETEEESKLKFTAGVSRKLGKEWAAGIEAVQLHAFEGTGLDEEEYSTTSVGPNIHFKRGNFYFTFAVLPQIRGDGDDADDNLQLAHAERLQTRLHASIEF